MSKNHPVPEGMTYRVQHIRPPLKDSPVVFDQFGGTTFVEIGIPNYDETGKFVSFDVKASGRADCSVLDRYNKKRGRDIALGRGLKKLYEGEGQSADNGQ